jgi:hypothetical protein
MPLCRDYFRGKYLAGATLARRSIREPTPKLAATGGIPAMAKAILQLAPRGKSHPSHADADRAKR